MDTVMLPLLDVIDTPLLEVLKTMKITGRSGVLVVSEGQVWLHKAGEVVVAISEGKQAVRDLERKWQVAVASEAQIAQPNLDWLNPHYTQEAFNAVLDDIDRLYLVMRAPKRDNRMLSIITRHEELARGVGDSGPADCYCNNTNSGPHEFRQMPHNRRCNVCGASIVCVYG